MDVMSKSVFSTANTSDISSWIKVVYDAIFGPTTISEYIKPVFITAPVFIQQDIRNEQVSSNLIKVLLDMYTGFVLTALNLNSFVTSSDTVKDTINKISTEDISQLIYINQDTLATMFFKNENINISLEKVSSVTQKNDSGFYAGRLINVKLSTATKKDSPIEVSIYVQFFVRSINNEFSKNLLDVSLSGHEFRFFEFLAGEISFWKDFMFSMDIAKKKIQLMKDDQDMVFRDIYVSPVSRFINRFIRLLDRRKPTSNVYNNIFVFDDNSFMNSIRKNGFNPNRNKDIETVMKNLKGVLIVRVNPMYQMVIIHVAGIPNRIELTFKEIRSKSSKQTDDLLNILTLLKTAV